MEISVVIPVLNEEKRIRNCIQALLNQEVKPDEIIVADAASTDNTAKIAKEMGVKIVEEPERGIAKTRNKGFNAAQYEIIARCDADSIVPTNWIKRIKEDFSKEKIDALTGPIIYFDLSPNNAIYSKIFLYLMKFIQGYHTLIGNNMALRKEMWEKIKDTACKDDKNMHEDIDLAIHVHKHGGVIKYDPLLIAKNSGRRIKNNPISFFIEYPIRLIKTILKKHS